MRVVTFKYGETVIRQDDHETRMYVILEGEVEIRLRSGEDEIVVSHLRRHDFFGEMSLFRNLPRSADVIARTDVRLAYIESLQQLQKFLVDNPTFAFKMVKILAERLGRTDELLIGKVSEVNRLKLTTVINEEDMFEDI
ncbi:MAG: cyclic nucleotide-binding domain-containing protein [Spirochaetes bacterium]|jgi:CRP/FNR family cyclic AMP-dependent transcriptional regulator|nr:cyclic nucleotide-binding domain-containing protein [Spirochaetota bacterium]